MRKVLSFQIRQKNYLLKRKKKLKLNISVFFDQVDAPKDVSDFFSKENLSLLIFESDLLPNPLTYYFDDAPIKEILTKIYREKINGLENKKNLPPEVIDQLLRFKINADWAEQEFQRYIHTKQGEKDFGIYEKMSKFKKVLSPSSFSGMGMEKFVHVFSNRRFSHEYFNELVDRYIHGITPKRSEDGGIGLPTHPSPPLPPFGGF